jgi:drug/metabolite transporter (DMT)-like permease
MFFGAIRGEYIVLLCTVLWAGSSIIAAPATKRVGALRFVGAQALLTCVGLLVVAPFVLSREDLQGLNWTALLGFFFLVAPLMGGGSVLFYGAIERIGVARAQPIASSYPLLTTLASVFLLGERPTLWVIGGTVAVVVGIGLISYSRTAPESDCRPQRFLLQTRGFWYALLAALLYSVGIVLMKVLLSEVHSLVGNLARTPGVAILVATILRARGDRRPIWSMSRRSWGLVAAATLLGHLTADTLYLYALQSSPASIAVPLGAAPPLWVAPLAYFFLGERLNWKIGFGILLAVLGIAAIVS